jgi:type IV secretion system protein TrbD
METRTVPIYQSLHRHSMFFGAERTPAMLAALIAGLVGIGGLSVITTVAAVLFWMSVIGVLRMIAKRDPLMSQVFLRHIKQQTYYPAKGTPWRKGEYKCLR